MRRARTRTAIRCRSSRSATRPSRWRCARRRKIRSSRSSPTWRAREAARLLRAPTVDNFQDHPSGGCRMGNDRVVERRRLVGTDARSREPVRRRRADVREWKLRERDAHVLRAGAALGARDGESAAAAGIDKTAGTRMIRRVDRGRAASRRVRSARSRSSGPCTARTSARRSIRRSPTSTAAMSAR